MSKSGEHQAGWLARTRLLDAGTKPAMFARLARKFQASRRAKPACRSVETAPEIVKEIPSTLAGQAGLPHRGNETRNCKMLQEFQ